MGSRWYPVDTATLFHHLRCFAKLAQYVSTRLAWERLDPPLRKRLENSFAWHDYGHSRGKIAPDLASPEDTTISATEAVCCARRLLFPQRVLAGRLRRSW